MLSGTAYAQAVLTIFFLSAKISTFIQCSITPTAKLSKNNTQISISYEYNAHKQFHVCINICINKQIFAQTKCFVEISLKNICTFATNILPLQHHHNLMEVCESKSSRCKVFVILLFSHKIKVPVLAPSVSFNVNNPNNTKS